MTKLNPAQGKAVAPFRDAPRGNTALIILDMITDMDFRGAETMLHDTQRAAASIAKLRDAADKARLPVIYVNDNFGEWHSERYRLVEHALAHDSSREFVAKLAPRD